MVRVGGVKEGELGIGTLAFFDFGLELNGVGGFVKRARRLVDEC